jgi:lysophospholipase L1-like esterase
MQSAFPKMLSAFGSTSNEVVSLVSQRARPRTIIPFGDSITETSSVREGGSSGITTQYGMGYAETAIRLAGGWTQIHNAGIAGNTSTQMLARIQSDVIAKQPGACLLMAGTNDVVVGMTTQQVQTCMNNIERMVLMLLNANILPILVTIPPKNGSAGAGEVVRGLTQRMIRFYYLLSEYYGIPLADIYRACVNPVNGTWTSGLASDGTHPDPAGIAVIAPIVANVLRNPGAHRASNYMCAVSNVSPNGEDNLLANGTFINSTTPPSPNGWTTNLTGNNSALLQANNTYPYVGNEFVHTKTGTGGAYSLYSAPFNVTPGNILRYSGSLAVEGAIVSAVTPYSVALEFNAGSVRRAIAGGTQTGTFDFAADLEVPVGAATASATVFCNSANVWRHRNFTVLDLTATRSIWQPGNQ